MTTLVNHVDIDSPPGQVWTVLTQLDLLATYDPGTKASVLTGPQASGVGAERRCDIRPGGWFLERVVAWEPDHTLAFELVSCSFPVSALRHDYKLIDTGDATRVEQVMTYGLKYKGLGRALDATFMRRKWDAGIKKFLGGLKQQCENTPLAPRDIRPPAI